jgi:hypothetical protein
MADLPPPPPPPPPPPTIKQIKDANSDQLLEGLKKSSTKQKITRTREMQRLLPADLMEHGGTKRNKKSFRRLVKKRNTKRRKSRRVR